MIDVKMVIINRDGDEITSYFPAKFEVCSRCSGNGSIVNPSIDGNGISQEQFNEDPEFEEAYFAGAYDIPCPHCEGKRVEPVIDISACTYAQKRLLVLQRQHEKFEHECWLESEAERKIGC